MATDSGETRKSGSLCSGIAGHFQSERVAIFVRNHWPFCSGIRNRIPPHDADAELARIEVISPEFPVGFEPPTYGFEVSIHRVSQPPYFQQVVETMGLPVLLILVNFPYLGRFSTNFLTMSPTILGIALSSHHPDVVVDWNCTGTHAVANYKKPKALKITFRVSRHPSKSVADRIRKRRLEKGLKQVELAELLDVHEMTVVNWETGKTRKI